MHLVKKEVVKKVIEEIQVFTHKDLFNIMLREFSRPICDRLRIRCEADEQDRQLFLDLMVSEYITKFSAEKLLEYCKLFDFVDENAELDNADVSA